MCTISVAARDMLLEVFRLRVEASKAAERGRHARAEELFERSLATAEAALPPDSLVVISSIMNLFAHLASSVPSAQSSQECGRAIWDAWKTQPRLLPISRRCLSLLDSRWRAGTLFEPTFEEIFFFDV